MKITAEMVKNIRSKTGCGMMDCKKALKECDCDEDKTIEYLRKKGMEITKQRGGRETSQGVVQAYIHMGGKIGVLVEVNCESDFVAKNEDFQEFVKNISMQIAATNPIGIVKEDIPVEVIDLEKEVFKILALKEGKPEKIIDKIVNGKLNKFYKDSCLMSQGFIKDPKISIETLLNELISKIGENIKIKRFTRYELGE